MLKKVCTKCKIEKDYKDYVILFQPHRRSPQLQSHCRTCQNEANKARYRKKKAEEMK